MRFLVIERATGRPKALREDRGCRTPEACLARAFGADAADWVAVEWAGATDVLEADRVVLADGAVAAVEYPKVRRQPPIVMGPPPEPRQDPIAEPAVEPEPEPAKG